MVSALGGLGRTRAGVLVLLVALSVSLTAVAAQLGQPVVTAAETMAPTSPGGPSLGPDAPVALPVAVGGLQPAAAPQVPEETPKRRRLLGALPGSATPVRIRVPSLSIDAPVIPISGASGVLEPPADATELGWWQEGAMPGAEQGSAVLTGHTLSQGDGVLDDLGDLTRGDLVSVETETGTIRYEVRHVRVISKAELAEQALSIFDRERVPRLVLITCADYTGDEYLSNAVVSAVPVSSRST